MIVVSKEIFKDTVMSVWSYHWPKFHELCLGLSTALPKKTWGWMGSWTWASNVPSQPRKPTLSLSASKAAWSAGRGRWSCPSAPCWWDLTYSTASRCGVLSTAETWSCWSMSRGGPEKCSKGWNISPMRTGWESWGCSAWRREGCKVTWQQPSISKGELQEREE